MAAPPDCVVVGAGHNGLITATYLAKAGLRVVVCERRDVVGGAAVTEELIPGFRVSTASYALSLFRPDVWVDLELDRRGVVVVAKDPQMFVPLEGGGHFFVWRDTARTKREIAALSAADAQAYSRWCAFWDDAVTRLRPLVDTQDPPRLAEVERLVGPDVWRWAVAGSAAETVEQFFEHPAVQGAFVSQGVIGTALGPREPGTAWVMAYHALGGELYGSSGTWGYVRGGMGALTSAIADAAVEAGAELRLGDGVVEVLQDGGRAVGARTENGKEIEAGVVVSGADPKTTARLAALDGWTDGWRTPGCVLKVNMALRELPNFDGLGTSAGPQHRGTVEICPSIDDLQASWEQSLTTGWSKHPFMEAFVASAVDPTLVDGDGHVVSAFTQYVSSQTDADWEGVREQATRAVVDTLATYAPNVPDAIVAIEALGPPELEARFGLSEGNIFHGELVPEQCFGERFEYRTPLPGLYLCGSGARPGGCVMGAAGRNAAKVVLRDLGRG